MRQAMRDMELTYQQNKRPAEKPESKTTLTTESGDCLQVIVFLAVAYSQYPQSCSGAPLIKHPATSH